MGRHPPYAPYPVPRPAAPSAPVSLGQLKHTFAFDLTGDSDGDCIPDAEDTSPLDPDRDGDGFNDGEDKWPDDPRRGDYIPPKFFAVTDLSAGLEATSPYKNAPPSYGENQRRTHESELSFTRPARCR